VEADSNVKCESIKKSGSAMGVGLSDVCLDTFQSIDSVTAVHDDRPVRHRAHTYLYVLGGFDPDL